MTFGDSPFVVPERPGKCPLRRTRSAGTTSAASLAALSPVAPARAVPAGVADSIPINQLLSENVFPIKKQPEKKAFFLSGCFILETYRTAPSLLLQCIDACFLKFINHLINFSSIRKLF